MFADSYAVNDLTVWTRSGTDKYGQPSYVRAGVVRCEFEEGGSMQRDEDGTEFVPMSTFYPVAGSIEIKRNDRVMLGDVADLTPPRESETVRKSAKYSAGYFGWPDETVVYTG